MTTLALYAASAMLFAAAPSDPTPAGPGYEPDPAATDPTGETAAPRDSSVPIDERPAPPLHARRPLPGDSAAAAGQGVSGAARPDPAFRDPTDAYLFQQQIWTAP